MSSSTWIYSKISLNFPFSNKLSSYIWSDHRLPFYTVTPTTFETVVFHAICGFQTTSFIILFYLLSFLFFHLSFLDIFICWPFLFTFIFLLNYFVFWLVMWMFLCQSSNRTWFFFYLTDALDLKFSDESDDLAEEGLTGPERTYRGPHINFPMQRKDLDVIIDLFRKKKVNFVKGK